MANRSIWKGSLNFAMVLGERCEIYEEWKAEELDLATCQAQAVPDLEELAMYEAMEAESLY